MKARDIDPRRLDVDAFTRHGAALDGRFAIGALERLASTLHPERPPAADAGVDWSLSGERIERVGAPPQRWLHLKAKASLALVCQRCLGPVETEVSVDRRFLFVEGEDVAAALDAEMEDDVLALTRTLDVATLLEDELLLALPLVPRHEQCPQSLPAPTLPAAEPPATQRQRPFEALRALRRTRDGGSEPDGS